MIKRFPVEFTLESGTHVVVNKTGDDTYDFRLRPSDNRPARQFTLDNHRSKTDVDDSLDFEQLDAVRKFWLENEDIV